MISVQIELSDDSETWVRQESGRLALMQSKLQARSPKTHADRAHKKTGP